MKFGPGHWVFQLVFGQWENGALYQQVSGLDQKQQPLMVLPLQHLIQDLRMDYF